jgi:hypothetical protein
MLTPVFMYEIQGATCFDHAGHFKNVKFEIMLRPYNHRLEFEAITQTADPSSRELLRQREIHKSDHYWHGPEPYILITDVTHPAGSIQDNLEGRTDECWTIEDAVAEALRLHSTRGLPSHGTYTFRCPSTESGLKIRFPNVYQCRYSYLGAMSNLKGVDFDACRSTIDVLLKGRDEKTTFGKVLGLALDYHRHSFTLEKPEHIFLILMVAFEAMFKKKDEDNASRAAKRIGRLLGATKAECMSIHKEFFDNNGDWFCKIRNDIAHGDTSLSMETVAGKYPSLYRHVTAAIVKLLNLPPGSLDTTKDYYDEISRLTEARFFRLPNS